MITIEIRGHQKAALDAAHRISAVFPHPAGRGSEDVGENRLAQVAIVGVVKESPAPFLPSCPCRLRRTPGEDEVQVRPRGNQQEGR